MLPNHLVVAPCSFSQQSDQLRMMEERLRVGCAGADAQPRRLSTTYPMARHRLFLSSTCKHLHESERSGSTANGNGIYCEETSRPCPSPPNGLLGFAPRGPIKRCPPVQSSFFWETTAKKRATSLPSSTSRCHPGASVAFPYVNSPDLVTLLTRA